MRCMHQLWKEAGAKITVATAAAIPPPEEYVPAALALFCMLVDNDDDDLTVRFSQKSRIVRPGLLTCHKKGFSKSPTINPSR